MNLKFIGRKAKHKIECFLETECKGNHRMCKGIPVQPSQNLPHSEPRLQG
jgi:hypothetical protein